LPFFARKTWTSLVGRDGAAPRVPYDRAAMLENPSLTWIGHSTLLVRMDGVTFLTDPIFSERASPVSFAGPKRLVPPGVPLDALPPIDFVTLSHDHYDHTDLASIEALARHGTRFVAGLEMGDLVRAAGGEVVELDWGESVQMGAVRVHCVPAQHFSGRSIVGNGRRLWAGWVVEGPTRRPTSRRAASAPPRRPRTSAPTGRGCSPWERRGDGEPSGYEGIRLPLAVWADVAARTIRAAPCVVRRRPRRAT